MKCFLIDDDPDDQDFFAFAVEDLPIKVLLTTAHNGIEALVLLHDPKYQPDIIFIDINMPRMDGWECLREIRKIQNLESVPVVIYSTSEYSKANYALSEDEFTTYLTKKSGVAALTEALIELFRKFDLIKKL